MGIVDLVDRGDGSAVGRSGIHIFRITCHCAWCSLLGKGELFSFTHTHDAIELSVHSDCRHADRPKRQQANLVEHDGL